MGVTEAVGPLLGLTDGVDDGNELGVGNGRAEGGTEGTTDGEAVLLIHSYIPSVLSEQTRCGLSRPD